MSIKGLSPAFANDAVYSALHLVGFFFVNMLVTGLVVWALMEFIDLKINKHPKALFALLLAIGTFIPGFGLVGGGILMVLLKRHTGDFKPVAFDFYEEIEYTRKNPIKTVSYGVGWASTRLQSNQFSTEQRKQALHTVTRGGLKDANFMYSQLVSDDVEELRVCAFSMLENQQNRLHQKINGLLKSLSATPDPWQSVFIEKQLALLYWELVYLNLSDHEFRALLLERSTYFAGKALDILNEDPSLWILLSRIDTLQGRKKEAYRHLQYAAEYGAPVSRIIPFFAEMAYQQKDYQTVKQLLSSDTSLKYIIKINKIVNFWCDK